jgi:hypothetical protein
MRGMKTLSLAAVLSVGMGCAAQERQRPLGIGDVRTGADTIEAVRRQLSGTWELVALESSPNPGAPRVAVQATGTLVYDEYGNLTIDARTTDPAAPVAAREVPVITFKGRAAIDPVKKELTMMEMVGNVDPDEVLSTKRRRVFQVDADTLKLSSIDESGDIAAVSTWRRRR